MEYVFGEVTRGDIVREGLKTKGDTHSDLSGIVNLKREFSDSIIYDTFKIVEKYKSQIDETGKCYDYYIIADHYRYEDRYTPNIGKVQESIDETQNGLMEAYDLSSGNADDIADLRTALEEVYEMLSEEE